MELFKILGKIAISNSEANKTIDETTDKAKKSVTAFTNGMNKINGIIGKVAKAALITGNFSFAAITKAAVGAYGDYEQLVGGVETLFKNSSQKVIGYANNAYKTAGLSANGYMETVTSFSASLLQGLGGDTEKATEVANLAITDMADNANKMGTSMESIQNAYQGFAKQNYTMLDNLKLGYGGTQAEMIRLINDSGVLNKKIKDLDNVSFDTMIQAIHKIQDNLGITGTTALEASTTIQGSWSSLKASWSNLMTGLADENADLDALITIVADNVGTVWENVKPRIEQVFDSIVGLLPDWAQDIIGKAEEAVSGVVEKFKVAKQFYDEHKEIINNLAIVFGILFGALEVGSVIFSAYNAILPVYTALTTGAALPTTALGGAIAFLTSPITLVVLAIGALIAAGVLLWKNWDWLTEKAGELKDKVIEKINNLKDSISNKFTEIKTNISDKCNEIKEGFIQIWNDVKENVGEAFETIKNIVQVGIMFIGEILSAAFQIITLPFQFIWENCKEYIIEAWNFIKDTISEALNAILTTISDIWNSIVEFFAPILEDIKNKVSEAWNTIKDNITSALDIISKTISDIWNAIISFLSPIFDGIKNKVAETWDSIKNKITESFNSVKSFVSDVINKIKSDISNKFNEAKTSVLGIFDGIKNGISDKLENARNVVSNAINKIKSYFNFNWELPKLKMPHFKISGSFSLNPPSVPSFGIDWYKDGGLLEGIMTEPTLMGFNAKTGRAQVGGEAGTEVAAPLDRLLGMIRQVNSEDNSVLLSILEKIYNLLSYYMPEIQKYLKNGQVIQMDSGALVGAIIDDVDQALDEKLDSKKRGN